MQLFISMPCSCSYCLSSMDPFEYFARNVPQARERFNCVISLFDDSTTEVSLTEITQFCQHVMDQPITDLYKEARKLITEFNRQLGKYMRKRERETTWDAHIVGSCVPALPKYAQMRIELGSHKVEDVRAIMSLSNRMKEQQARWIKTKTERSKMALPKSPASMELKGKGKRKQREESPIRDEETHTEATELWDDFTTDVVHAFLQKIDKDVISSYGRGTRIKEKLQSFAELLTSIGKAAYMLTENYEGFGAPVSALLKTFKTFSSESSARSRQSLTAASARQLPAPQTKGEVDEKEQATDKEDMDS